MATMQQRQAQELQALVSSPTNPAGKLLRELGVHSVQDAMQLDVISMLRALPRKERTKYGKRKKLTDAERNEQTKRRNREHARSTRARKKLIVEALQIQVDELQRRLEPLMDCRAAAAAEAVTNEADAAYAAADAAAAEAPADVACDQARRRNLCAFFELGGGSSDVQNGQQLADLAAEHLRASFSAWSDVVTQDFFLSTPALPCRLHDGSGALLVSQVPRAVVGVAALSQETMGLPWAILDLVRGGTLIAGEAAAAPAVTAVTAALEKLPPAPRAGPGSTLSAAGRAAVAAKAAAAAAAAATAAALPAACAVRWELDKASVLTMADKAMCNWTMHISLSTAAGAALRPIAVKGMAKCRFQPPPPLPATFAPAAAAAAAAGEAGAGAEEGRLAAVDLRFDAMGLCSLLEAATGRAIMGGGGAQPVPQQQPPPPQQQQQLARPQLPQQLARPQLPQQMQMAPPPPPSHAPLHAPVLYYGAGGCHQQQQQQRCQDVQHVQQRSAFYGQLPPLPTLPAGKATTAYGCQPWLLPHQSQQQQLPQALLTGTAGGDGGR